MKRFEEFLAEVGAEIAKARGAMPVGPLSDRLSKQVVIGHTGSNIDRRVSSLAGGLDEVERRLAALESSEVELREHCQGNVPMSVFNDLRERVESMSEDLTSLENQVARELRALPDRVKALESKPKMSLADDVWHAQLLEDDAYKAWRREPWPDDVVKGGHGVQLEEAFRAGFRAGRK